MSTSDPDTACGQDKAKKQDEKRRAGNELRGVIDEDWEKEPDKSKDEEAEAAQLATLLDFVAKRDQAASSQVSRALL